MSKPRKQTPHATNQKRDRAGDEPERATVFEQEDAEILYRALRAHQPRGQEAQRHELLVEQLEEILAVGFELLEIPY